MNWRAKCVLWYSLAALTQDCHKLCDWATASTAVLAALRNPARGLQCHCSFQHRLGRAGQDMHSRAACPAECCCRYAALQTESEREGEEREKGREGARERGARRERGEAGERGREAGREGQTVTRWGRQNRAGTPPGSASGGAQYGAFMLAIVINYSQAT